MFTKLISYFSIISLPFSLMADLKLSDFEGSFVTYSQMFGGITGYSATHLSHITFDANGNGRVDFDSNSIDGTGPAGTPLFCRSTNLANARTLIYTIQITDPIHNCGRIILSDLDQTTEIYSDFVAIKNKEKVIEIYQNMTGNSGPALGMASIMYCKRI